MVGLTYMQFCKEVKQWLLENVGKGSAKACVAALDLYLSLFTILTFAVNVIIMHSHT